MDDYLVKPVDVDEVRAALDRWVLGMEATPLASGPPSRPEGPLGPGRLAPDWTTGPTEHGEAARRSPLLAPLVEPFLASVPGDLARLRAAVAREEAMVVQQIAHYLRAAR
jgi:hypothetical protein